MNSDKLCPICQTKLVDQGQEYSVEELFDLWNVGFSDQVLIDHKSQSEYTSLFECPECGLGIFLPIIYGTSGFYSELQNKTNYYENDKWDFDEAIKDLVGLKNILEIGCGPGNFLARCKYLGLECFGSEYNDDASRLAKEKGIDILNQSQLDAKSGSFDAVLSFHVLEHVSDPLLFLKLHVSMVKTGGKICISVPNQDGPLKYINPCIMNMPPHHLTRWNIVTFKKIAKKLNLEIERVSYEPLLLTNHSYYSYYFLNYILPLNNKLFIIIKNFLHVILVRYFNYQMHEKKKNISLY